MKMLGRLAILTGALTSLASPSIASAATLATPADGAVVTQGQSVLYDWAWDSDEYATSAIVLTQSADPNDPIWLFGPTVPANPGRVMYTDGGYPFIDSHASRPALGLVVGTWYWRLCNKSIYGEDDKCSYDANVPPRALVVTDGPDCNDGFDNDNDGSIDYPRDDDCVSQTDTVETTPAPAPQPKPAPSVPPSSPKVTLLSDEGVELRLRICARRGSYKIRVRQRITAGGRLRHKRTVYFRGTRTSNGCATRKVVLPVWYSAGKGKWTDQVMVTDSVGRHSRTASYSYNVTDG